MQRRRRGLWQRPVADAQQLVSCEEPARLLANRCEVDMLQPCSGW
jgi:hypothetical protein